MCGKVQSRKFATILLGISERFVINISLGISEAFAANIFARD